MKLEGSPEKDVKGACEATVVGAEVVSGSGWVRRGCVTVGAPRARRAALTVFSLKAAARPKVPRQLVKSLLGSWNAAFMYRRPLFALFTVLYQHADGEDDEDVDVGARGREELVLAALLAPLALTELDAPVCPTAFALDASLQWGAICETSLDPGLAAVWWDAGEKRGGYSRLDVPARAVRRSLGYLGSDDAVDCDFGSVLPAPSARARFLL